VKVRVPLHIVYVSRFMQSTNSSTPANSSDTAPSGFPAVGSRVAVTQQMPARAQTMSTTVIGVVVKYEQRKTGSWFAHSAGDRLWLDRVVLRKADGEISTLNLDEFTRVEVME